jgi:hypothetical protein
MKKRKEDVKKRKTYTLRLTKFELLHMRDVFGIVLPPTAEKTLSQSLAELEKRVIVESSLWNKIIDACEEAGLPVGEDAPDYVVAPSAPPTLGVFQLASEPPEEEEESKQGGGLTFIKGAEEESEEEDDEDSDEADDDEDEEE